MKRSMLYAAILGTFGLSSTFSVLALDYNLCAGTFEKQLSADATDTVTMWGYAEGLANVDGTACVNTPTSPGPRISLPDGDTVLNVSLHNTLPRATSLIIPGTVKAEGMAPTFFTYSGTPRVLSFDVEAAANGGTATYSWDTLSPGSYMYHSGTHPQVQVQMGLFGAATADTATGEAYEGHAYSRELILFYSELDRAIHDGVVNGDYGATIVAGGTYDATTPIKSTIDYAPKYFFIDVDAATGALTYIEDEKLIRVNRNNAPLPLIRFYNAGQKTHIPTIIGAEFDILAEDGKLYPNARRQYSVTLPPLKTRDAILDFTDSLNQTPNRIRLKLIDSAMALSNPDQLTGAAIAASINGEIANGDGNGMLLNIEIDAEAGYVAPVISGDEPKANRDNMSVAEGSSKTAILANAMSNDVNATGTTATILSYPKHGELVSDGSGDFSYQHDGGEKSQDSMVYSLTNAAGESSTAGIILDIAPVNDNPEANDDTVNTSVGKSIEIRALRNDEDVDSPRLTITGVDTSTLGALTALDQVIIFEPTTEGSEDVAYTISDGSGGSSSAVLHLSVTAATSGSGTYGGGSGSSSGGTPTVTGTPPEALDDSFTVVEGDTLDITGNSILSVMANDSPGALVDTSLVEYPEHGSIQMLENGTFIYTHDGSEDDDDRFIYEIYNDHGTSKAEVVINITAKMDPPHVNNDRANTQADTAVLIDLLRNDKDKDSALNMDPNAIVITRLPEHGVVEKVTQGNVRYTPDAGYRGRDYFRYQLKDSVTGELSERAAKVKVKIK